MCIESLICSGAFLYADAETVPWTKCGQCPLRKKSKGGIYRCSVNRKKVKLRDKCLFEPEGGLTYRQAAYILHRHVKWRHTLMAPKETKISIFLLDEAINVAIRGLRRQSLLDPNIQLI